MQFQLPIQLNKPSTLINYQDKIMLIGSCFTEHIGNALQDLKFSVLQNPNGILFGPDAVSKSLLSYIQNYQYQQDDLFLLNEVWNSWNHHSRFSDIDAESCLHLINTSQQTAHDFLKTADWLIITLGSSFSYQLTDLADKAKFKTGDSVANCHRAPSNWFHKTLQSTEEIIEMLSTCLAALRKFNPGIKIIFTVSPVRHIRDGVVANNRSKARLIEAVHQLTDTLENYYYFPAYELVIDVLRDYRFYDIDLVHPNYAATEFVLEHFTASCIDSVTQDLMEDVRKIVIAAKHKAFQPATKAHQQFLINHFEKATQLQKKHPFLNLKNEILYFSQT